MGNRNILCTDHRKRSWRSEKWFLGGTSLEGRPGRRALELEVTLGCLALALILLAELEPLGPLSAEEREDPAHPLAPKLDPEAPAAVRSLPDPSSGYIPEAKPKAWDWDHMGLEEGTKPPGNLWSK